MDSKTAIDAAGLNWSLYKNDIWTVDADNNKIEVKDQYAIVRGDTSSVLGIVGKNYKIFENYEAFKFFDDVVGEKLAVYETAGSLKGGKIVWILAKLPNEIRIGKTDDVSDPYVMLATSHDGTRSLMMMPTLVRVVCNNTFTIATRDFSVDTGIRVRHTGNMSNKVDLAKERLAIVNKSIETFSEKAQFISSKMISVKQLESYVEDLFPDNKNASKNTRTENIRQSIYNNFENSEISSTNGTWWKAFNAVTQFVDHQRSTKGSDDSQRSDNRMISCLMTTGASKKRDALSLALEMSSV